MCIWQDKNITKHLLQITRITLHRKKKYLHKYIKRHGKKWQHFKLHRQIRCWQGLVSLPGIIIYLTFFTDLLNFSFYVPFLPLPMEDQLIFLHKFASSLPKNHQCLVWFLSVEQLCRRWPKCEIIMKRKLRHWWTTIPSISTKATTTFQSFSPQTFENM